MNSCFLGSHQILSFGIWVAKGSFALEMRISLRPWAAMAQLPWNAMDSGSSGPTGVWTARPSSPWEGLARAKTRPRHGTTGWCTMLRCQEQGEGTVTRVWQVYDCIGPLFVGHFQEKSKRKGDSFQFTSCITRFVGSSPSNAHVQSISFTPPASRRFPPKKANKSSPFHSQKEVHTTSKRHIPLYSYTQQIPIFIKLPNQKRAKLPAFLRSPQLPHTLRHVRPLQPAPQHQRAGPLPVAVARAPGTLGWPGPLQPGTPAEGHRGEIGRAAGPLRERWLGCLHGGIWMLKHQTWEKKLGLDPQTWEIGKI